MSHQVLLIDFGATRIKSVLVSLVDGSITRGYSSPGSSVAGAKLPASFFADALVDHLKYSSAKAKVAAILMCCEMHGFVRATSAPREHREYVSWRHSSSADDDTIVELTQLGYQQATGIRPRRGLPAVRLLSDKRIGLVKESADATISFLPDDICRQLGYSKNVVHASLAHGSGLFTTTNEPLINFGLDNFMWPSLSTDDLIEIGHVRFEAQNIPCFGGYGDLQASVFGMSPSPDNWIINLGTGSQIVSMQPTQTQEFEKRKYFGNQTISCVTHIPAGRALNVFADFFKDIRQDESADYLWKMLSAVVPTPSCSQRPEFNLAVFPEASTYVSGGHVGGIHEGSFRAQDFFEGLLDSFLTQYLTILRIEDPQMTRPILIAGRMAQKMSNIQEWFGKNWNASVDLGHETLDPTLACMAKISIASLAQRL